jgi:excisionase family DNA binding protein
MTFDNLLTLDEVSEHLRVPVGTLRRWHVEGRGPKSFHVGRRIVVKETDLAAWLDEQYAGAGAGRDAAA